LKKNKTYQSKEGIAMGCLKYENGYLIPVLAPGFIVILYAQINKKYIPNMLPMDFGNCVPVETKISGRDLIIKLAKVVGNTVEFTKIMYGLTDTSGTIIAKNVADQYVSPRIISCNSMIAIYDQHTLYSKKGAKLIGDLRGCYVSTDCIVGAMNNGQYYVVNSKESQVINVRPYPKC
jgi:hypothetical protein